VTPKVQLSRYLDERQVAMTKQDFKSVFRREMDLQRQLTFSINQTASGFPYDEDFQGAVKVSMSPTFAQIFWRQKLQS